MSIQNHNYSIAYLYERVSSDTQIDGDGLKRQAEATTSFCERNSILIDHSLSFSDQGLSAYKRENIKTDAGLARFISACESGLIDPNGVLVVEALDRLSRDTVMNALQQFLNILSYCNVVTLTAGRETHYHKDDKDLTIKLIMALMEMQAAHAYSAGISDRVGAAWRSKKQTARETKKPISKRVPFWLSVVNDSNGKPSHFEVIPERAAVIVTIFNMSIDG